MTQRDQNVCRWCDKPSTRRREVVPEGLDPKTKKVVRPAIYADVCDEHSAMFDRVKLIGEVVTERGMLIDYVLERLDDLKTDLAAIEDAIDPPHQPPRGFDVPHGGMSALESIAAAIFTAERRWMR